MKITVIIKILNKSCNISKNNMKIVVILVDLKEKMMIKMNNLMSKKKKLSQINL